MFDDGEKLVPGFRQARALRVWTGVRPLFEDAKASETDTRDVTRAHALLDHQERDGVRGFVTITGGKLTTFRLMAQETVDAVCRHLGTPRACRTDTEPLPGSESGQTYRLGERLARKEAHLTDGAARLRVRAGGPLHAGGGGHAHAAAPTWTTSAGSFASAWVPARAGSASTAPPGSCTPCDGISGEQADASLLGFLQERWKGVWPVLYGDQLRQTRLDDWIFHGILDVEHLPS